MMDNIPQHVAIILDGNRRWAKKRDLPVIAGHKKVVEERVEELIEAAAEIGIAYITFWAFSTENWGRDKKEVEGIMKLFLWAIEKKGKKLIDKGARLKMIGDVSRFEKKIRQGMMRLMKASEKNRRITVTFALNYGGRDEMLRAIKKLVEAASGDELLISKLNEKTFDSFLDTAEMPDPDLIIRTSGEQRLSGFMLWQSAYSEFYFTRILMPNFGKQELLKAIEEYQKRNRRFGGG